MWRGEEGSGTSLSYGARQIFKQPTTPFYDKHPWESDKREKKRKKQRKTEEHEGTKTAWAGEKLKQNECSNSRKEQDHSHVKPFTEQTKKASNKVGESNK